MKEKVVYTKQDIDPKLNSLLKRLSGAYFFGLLFPLFPPVVLFIYALIGRGAQNIVKGFDASKLLEDHYFSPDFEIMRSHVLRQRKIICAGLIGLLLYLPFIMLVSTFGVDIDGMGVQQALIRLTQIYMVAIGAACFLTNLTGYIYLKTGRNGEGRNREHVKSDLIRNAHAPN